MILHAVRVGAGTPLVVLHGLFGSAANWGRVGRALAVAHDVVALDLRNHGSSPHDADTSYAAMAGDVAETLAALGLEQAGLIGHSMGGKVAMHLALTRPGLVSRLLVADIAPVGYEPHFRGITDALLSVPLHSGLTRAEANDMLAATVSDPALRGFLLQNLSFTATPRWRIGLDEIAAGLPKIEDWPSLAGTYSGPVLVLRGENSSYVLPEHRPLFRALFPRARFASLRDAGHWLHAEQPEAFIATARSFFG